MGGVNVTVRIDEETKKAFDQFCDNVGMNITTAFNMFIKATLRARQLPFAVTDTDIQTQKHTREAILAMGKEALREAQAQSIINGTADMTMEEIDAEIAEYRREKSAVKC